MNFDRIQTWDLHQVRSLSKWPWLCRHPQFLKFLTRLGDGWIWGLVCLALVLFYTRSQVETLLCLGLSAGLISLLIYESVKLSTRRLRPFAVDPSLSPEVPPMDKYSFPSGHVMNNFAVGLALALISPSLGIPLMVLALIWGLLRIHFCVHYPTDILVGMALSFPSVALAWTLQKHLLPQLQALSAWLI